MHHTAVPYYFLCVFIFSRDFYYAYVRLRVCVIQCIFFFCYFLTYMHVKRNSSVVQFSVKSYFLIKNDLTFHQMWLLVIGSEK